MATIKMGVGKSCKSILCLLFCDIFNKSKTSMLPKPHWQPQTLNLMVRPVSKCQKEIKSFQNTSI